VKKVPLFLILVICLIQVFFLVQGVEASSLDRNVLNVRDTNPNSSVFEAELIADEQDVMIGGSLVHALVYKDANNITGAYSGTPDGIPVPQIVVDVGDEVIVKLTNNLENNCAAFVCDTSIHWHGIELDNDSDGTGVTQNHLKPGETYIYRFKAHRPGLFWFHPHMEPGPQTFAGMYGALIVKDPDETALQTARKIPGVSGTHTIVLSDIEFDTADATGVEPGEEGKVGYVVLGVAQPWAWWKERCAEGFGDGDIAAQQAACRLMNDGLRVLVNGRHPFIYTAEANFIEDIPTITATSGEGIRLRLINTATNRYFRLSVTGNGTDNKLYRIGGEGGFLEKVRLEGGMLASWDTKYEKGEIVVPASGRADVVIVPTGTPGDIITITGVNYDRGGPSGLNTSKPAGPLLQIKITGNSSNPFSISEGQEVLSPGSIENLKTIPAAELDALSEPPPKTDGSGSERGSTDATIVLEGIETGELAINGVQGHFEDSGADYTQIPYQGATRYARGGDVLEWTVRNDTGGQHHPFHLHGFSFQPVRVLDNATGNTLYSYDYQEFQDVIDVFHGQSVVFRVRLDDRPRITDTRQEAGAPAPNQSFPNGGVVGRWVFHCHLFLHAAIGMISELVVLDSNSPPDAQCTERRVATDPGLCTASGVSIDNGTSDPEDDSFTLAQDPDNPYPLGDTDVTLTATDKENLTDSCQATVTVIDQENPTINAPDAVQDECDATGGSTLVALGNPDTNDNCSIDTISNDAPGLFPLGNTTVNWTVTDGSSNSAMDAQTVTVVDTTAPSLSAPANISKECDAFGGTSNIDLGPTVVTDICDPDVTVTQNAPEFFPIGNTNVQWTATDNSDNSSQAIQSVSVVDTTPPLISCNTPSKIAPSDVIQTYTATATDTCDAEVIPITTGFDCFSFNPAGKNVDRTDGCEVTINGNILSIVDSGGVGDLIEWTIEATDESGNTATEICTISVVRKKDL
jgi:FtsP/CotA-like multicopper oxidase with cupredoxin domain